MKDYKEVFGSINKIIDWYRGMPKELNVDVQSIQSLNKARRKLACLKVDLSTIASEFRKMKEQAAFNRKKAIAQKIEEFRNADYSIADSKEKALIHTKKLKEKEIQFESAYENVKLLNDSIGDVLNAMAGDINYLVYEYKMIGVVQAA